MLLFFDLSGLQWWVYNLFVIACGAAILLVALIVGLITRSKNKKPFKHQAAFGFIKGALFPFIGGILGLCAHPSFFETSTRKAFDDLAMGYITILAAIMIIVIFVHFSRKRKRLLPDDSRK